MRINLRTAPSKARKHYRLLLSAWRIPWRSSKKYTSISLMIILARSILPALSLLVLKLIIDEVTQLSQSESAVKDSSSLVVGIGLFGLIYLTQSMLGQIGNLVSNLLNKKVAIHLLDLLHEHSLSLDLEFLESSEYIDKYNLAVRQSPHRPIAIVNSSFSLLQNSISLFFILGIVLAFDWLLMGFLVLMTIPSLIVNATYSKIEFNWERKKTPLEKKSWYYASLITMGNMAKEVRLFGIGDMFKNRSLKYRKKVFDHDKKLIKRKNSRFMMAKAIESTSLIVILVKLVFDTINNLMTLGQFVMYFQAFQKIQSISTSVFREVATLYEGKLFLDYLFEFLSLEPKIEKTSTSKSLRFPKRLKSGLRIENLFFKYPDQNEYVINGISLDIPPGAKIGIVGENGAGKSTLMKLICRLYDPKGGSIFINENQITDYNIQDLRKNISVVSQDFLRYQMTVRENIWLGDIDQNLEDTLRLTESSKIAGAHSMIEELKEQYDSVLGKLFQGGQELSTGQWQKIALARMVYRGAPIMILDEPTNNLDPQMESVFLRNLMAKMEGAMVIIISHHISTLRFAEEIIVLDKGRIVEGGSIDFLLQKQGKFYQMFGDQELASMSGSHSTN